MSWKSSFDGGKRNSQLLSLLYIRARSHKLNPQVLLLSPSACKCASEKIHEERAPWTKQYGAQNITKLISGGIIPNAVIRWDEHAAVRQFVIDSRKFDHGYRQIQAELRDRHHVSATEGQLKRLVQEATSNGEIAPSTKRREKNPWTHEQCNFINSLLANRYDRDEGQDMESWSFWEYAETAMRREFGVQRKAHSIYTWVREQ